MAFVCISHLCVCPSVQSAICIVRLHAPTSKRDMVKSHLCCRVVTGQAGQAVAKLLDSRGGSRQEERGWSSLGNAFVLIGENATHDVFLSVWHVTSKLCLHVGSVPQIAEVRRRTRVLVSRSIRRLLTARPRRRVSPDRVRGGLTPRCVVAVLCCCCSDFGSA